MHTGKIYISNCIFKYCVFSAIRLEYNGTIETTYQTELKIGNKKYQPAQILYADNLCNSFIQINKNSVANVGLAISKSSNKESFIILNISDPAFTNNRLDTNKYCFNFINNYGGLRCYY